MAITRKSVIFDYLTTTFPRAFSTDQENGGGQITAQNASTICIPDV